MSEDQIQEHFDRLFHELWNTANELRSHSLDHVERYTRASHRSDLRVLTGWLAEIEAELSRRHKSAELKLWEGVYA